MTEATRADYLVGLNAFYTQVFTKMIAGLGVTTAVILAIYSIPGLMESLFTINTASDGKPLMQPGLLWIVAAVAEFALVFIVCKRALSSNAKSSAKAYTLFMVYAALNGITFAPVIDAYTTGSVFMATLSGTSVFGVAAVYGYFTKRNLMKLGSIIFCGLIALIGMSIINIFIGSSTATLAISAIAVVLFTVITAFDMQKLRNMYNDARADELEGISTYGALSLYLDLINIIIHMLRIFGQRR